MQIVRTFGFAGSALFEDADGNQADTISVTGDGDSVVRVRGGDVSDLPRNLEVQAYPPDASLGVASSAAFTVFFTQPEGYFTGPVPPFTAWPILDRVTKTRQDHQNLLGIALADPAATGRQTPEVMGFKVTAYVVFPVANPANFQWDLRRGSDGSGFDIKRKVTGRSYTDGCLDPGNQANDFEESSGGTFKDLTADITASGYLAIYDLDAPSLPADFGLKADLKKDHDRRNRVNFTEWATYADDEGTVLRVSDNFAWFFRGAWHWDAKTQRSSLKGEAADNQVDMGSTPLTWDFGAAPPPQDFSITGFAPQGAWNYTPPIDIVISGSFPPDPTAQCDDYQVYLFAKGDDPTGDPGDPIQDQTYYADSVKRSGDGSQLTATFTGRPGYFMGSMPIPAGTYEIRVVHGLDYRKTGPFQMSEAALFTWTITGGDLRGDPLVFNALGLNLSRNPITRPPSEPVFEQIGGNVQLGPFTTYGAYGEYWGKASKLNPNDKGTVTVRVSGGGGLPAVRTVTIN